jgi:hypothetical protein
MLCWATFHPLKSYSSKIPLKHSTEKIYVVKKQPIKPTKNPNVKATPSTESTATSLHQKHEQPTSHTGVPTPLTQFELQLIHYKEDERICEEMKKEVKLLCNSIGNRDRRNSISSTSRVVCAECDMHFWFKSSINN